MDGGASPSPAAEIEVPVRWSADPQLVVVDRPGSGFLSTWALAMTVPLFWAVAPFVPMPPLLVALAIVAVPLAWVDAQRTEQVFGLPFAHPLLAALSPVLYLLVRLLRAPDPHAGRPLWIALALVPLVVLFQIFAAAGAYGMAAIGS